MFFLLSYLRTKEKTHGLLGFYIHKKNIKKDTSYDIESTRFFEEVVASPEAGARYNTKYHPWQSFLWEDFSVEHKAEYEYVFTPVYGSPGNLEYGKKASLGVVIPSPRNDIHEVYFNRGVAGSQAYARDFGNVRPDKMEPAKKEKALKWLSKGLKEAMLNFICKAKDETYQLRCCYYEFEYQEVLLAMKQAVARKVDVRIIYDARGEAEKNEEAIDIAKLPKRILIKRSSDPNYLQHNKFMVLLKNKKPVAVWTGSTNITEKGIYGQCNVGHIINDSVVAEKYFTYWKCLQQDPLNAVARTGSLNIQPDIDEISDGVTVFFSPREKTNLLNLYSNIVTSSVQLVCGMFPFSFNKNIKKAIVSNTYYFIKI